MNFSLFPIKMGVLSVIITCNFLIFFSISLLSFVKAKYCINLEGMMENLDLFP